MKVIRSQDRQSVVIANNISVIAFSEKDCRILATGSGTTKGCVLGCYSTLQRAEGMLNLITAFIMSDEGSILEMWPDDEKLDQERRFR